MTESIQRRCHLRLSEVEYQSLLNDVTVHGGTAASLIKKVYFGKKLPHPSMNPEDAAKLLGAINRVGNNVNQIARQLNKGFREGFSPVLEDMAQSLHEIKLWVRGEHGNSQN